MSGMRDEEGAVLVVLLGAMVVVMTLGVVITSSIGETAYISQSQQDYNQTIYLAESMQEVLKSLGRDDFIQQFETGVDTQRTYAINDMTPHSSVIPVNTTVTLTRTDYESFSALVNSGSSSSQLPAQVLFPYDNLGENQGLIPDDTGRLAGKSDIMVKQALWATVQSSTSNGSYDSICGVKVDGGAIINSSGDVLSTSNSTNFGDVVTNSSCSAKAISITDNSTISGVSVVGYGADENSDIDSQSSTIFNSSHLSKNYDFKIFGLPQFETTDELEEMFEPNQNVLFSSVVEGGDEDDEPVDAATAKAELIAYISTSNQISIFRKIVLIWGIYDRFDPENPDLFISFAQSITSNQDILNKIAETFDSMVDNDNGGDGGSNGEKSVHYSLSVGSNSGDDDVESDLMSALLTGNVDDITSIELNDGVVLYVKDDMNLNDIDVTVRGAVKIIVGGDLTISGSESFVVEENSELSLYVNGDFKIDGGALNLTNETLIVTRQSFIIENGGMIDLNSNSGNLTVHAQEKILLYGQPFTDHMSLDARNVVFICNGINNLGTDEEPVGADSVTDSNCQVLFETDDGGITGIIYAPYSAALFKAADSEAASYSRQFRGSVIAHAIRASDKFTISYDESLD